MLNGIRQGEELSECHFNIPTVQNAQLKQYVVSCPLHYSIGEKLALYGLASITKKIPHQN